MVRTPSFLTRFARSEGGTITVEFLLVIPVLLWAYMALFVYWDAFRATNLAQKASYTVADYISRERGTLTAAEIAGLDRTFKFMVGDNGSVELRFTSIYYNIATKRFEVYWSRSPNNTLPQLTNTTLQGYALQIPAMSDGDSAILVESGISYTPAFDVGIGNNKINNFIVTRPRFLTRICLEGVTCS